ncbi:MAG: EF-P beta-lysylation protein EpmB [Pseudomonadota bacterium]
MNRLIATSGGISGIDPAPSCVEGSGSQGGTHRENDSPPSSDQHERPRGSWQTQLRDAIRTPLALAHALGIDLRDLPYSLDAQESFPLLVPKAYVQRIKRGDPEDPLLRQVLASVEELNDAEGFGKDPVGEVQYYAGKNAESENANAVLQKYSGRALLVVTGQCAINCRYCFRRHYPYEEQRQSSRQRQATLNQLLESDELKELILSGGDPLILPDSQLEKIARQVGSRPDVTLRIHSRLPIVIPDRVTEQLLDALCGQVNKVAVVLHSNHHQEIDAQVKQAIRRMRDRGITVLNQSVMLAKVNDNAAVLAQLSDRLFDAGALPYYIHLLDRVSGAAHFEVEEDEARRIIGELAELRPGYLVPRLAREITGAGSKRQLAPIYPT